ncbi:hypothetical protein Hanom_Chr05g00416571 [Helianthus anomalus]
MRGSPKYRLKVRSESDSGVGWKMQIFKILLAKRVNWMWWWCTLVLGGRCSSCDIHWNVWTKDKRNCVVC